MVRGSRHAHVAMSKLVQVILAERQIFEWSIQHTKSMESTHSLGAGPHIMQATENE